MKIRVSIALCVLALFAVSAFAQHDHHGQTQPAMDAKMMEAMTKAATPGAEHKMLAGMAGKWDAKVTFWMMPGAPASTMDGISENTAVMGGRYIEQRFTGAFMGMPFEGVGYTGYDNVKKQYWGTWMDNMSTGLMVTTGGPGADGAWTFTGTVPDPMTGKDAKVEAKMKIVDADHHTYEMWTPGPDGKMFKTMEIAYSRKK